MLQLKSKTNVKLIVKGNGHYYKKGRNEDLWPSVTTVLGKVLAKPALVPWAQKITLKRCEEVLRGMQYDIAEHAGWDYYVTKVITESRREPEKLAEQAADIGTRAHDAIHKMLTGQTYEITDDIKPCIESFMAWYEQSRLQIDFSEICVASETLKVGGTIDSMGRRKGIGRTPPRRRILLDWKTSKGIYPEYGYQVGGYATCFEETVGEPIDEAWIIRFPKEKSETMPFEAKKIADLKAAQEGFARIKAVYDSLLIPMFDLAAKEN